MKTVAELGDFLRAHKLRMRAERITRDRKWCVSLRLPLAGAHGITVVSATGATLLTALRAAVADLRRMPNEGAL